MLIYVSLIFALSVDTFIAALSYEGSKIEIPFSSNLIISLICSLSLIISLIVGNFIDEIISTFVLKLFSFFVLFLIGIFKIFDTYSRKNITKKINFSFRNLNFVIEIYNDYKKADFDNSKKLSKIEAIYLSLALSIDSLGAGMAFQTNYILFIPIFILCFFVNVISIFSSKIIKKINIDFSLIGGIIFIVLAFLKI